MQARSVRNGGIVAATLIVLTLGACAGSPREGVFTRLLISGEEIREAGYDSAYEALKNHRQLIVFEEEIGFKGGDDYAFGRAAQGFYVPLLVVDGDWNLNDNATTLRRISADEIVSIRLYRASQVPPRYRRPGAEGGVIEVRTT
ncbi:MAG: hypothetical protein R3266_06830 [Gemmatimonadota bacterium]|nr:hypothetical protein [Gemmatimonadota bacterium]